MGLCLSEPLLLSSMLEGDSNQVPPGLPPFGSWMFVGARRWRMVLCLLGPLLLSPMLEGDINQVPLGLRLSEL